MDALIDLNDVRVFVDVVRAGSFSAAAKQHGVPTSTISRRIARLESAFNLRLLERTTRRLRVTEAGRTYFAHAERAVDELTQGSDTISALDASPRGRVRITAPIGLGRLLSDILAPYLAATRSVSIEIELTDRRVDLLAEGFDIAVRSGAVDTPDFAGRKIFETTRGLYASKAYLERHGRPKRLADLAGHDLIATRTSTSGAVWELLAGKRRHRFAFKPRLVVNDLVVARAAAAAGVGIALVPLPEDEPKRLERVLPAISGGRSSMWVLFPAHHRVMTAAVRSCVDHILANVPAAP
jgi:DNA-binding transcriptional LysR family regulator